MFFAVVRFSGRRRAKTRKNGKHGTSGKLEKAYVNRPFSFAFRVLAKGLAEREGFEPPIPVKVWLISSQLHSTGLCHLSAWKPTVAVDSNSWAQRLTTSVADHSCVAEAAA
jgi:hypothetical protein